MNLSIEVADDLVVSRTELARMIGVTRQRMSQLCAEGKIPAAAFVGSGPTAQIRAKLAIEHLRRVMHPGQLLARAMQDLQDGRTPALAPAEAPVPASRDLSFRLQELKLEEAEDARAERLRRRLREAGDLMETGEARRAWAKQMAELVRAIDAWLPDLGRSLAGELGADPKVVTVRLRQDWRAFRLRLVAAADAQAAAEGELVDAAVAADPAQEIAA